MPRIAAALLTLALAAPAWAHGGPPTGTVLVVNESGGTVTVTAPDLAPRTLRPGEQVSFASRPGETTVRATYRQFGRDEVLEAERAVVRPHRTSVVVLDPEDEARVLVRNATPHGAELVVDGRNLGWLDGGQSRVVEVDLGPTSLDLIGPNGRSVAHTHLQARAFAEQSWTAELPRLADVTVVNPLPIPVVLTSPGGRRTVPAYGRTVYEDVAYGTFQLTASRTTGELIDREALTVRPEGASWRIDAPRTGRVLLDSDHYEPTRVLVDGQPVASLAPFADSSVELTLGWHRVAFTDARGRIVEDTWVEVHPYELGSVVAALPSREAHPHSHHERPTRDGVADAGHERPSGSHH